MPEGDLQWLAVGHLLVGGLAHIHRVVGSVDHLHRLAGPRILPSVDDVARGRIEVDHDLARDASEARAAHGVDMSFALACIDPDDREQLAIFFAGSSAVEITLPHAIASDPGLGRPTGELGAPLQCFAAFTDRGRREEIIRCCGGRRGDEQDTGERRQQQSVARPMRSNPVRHFRPSHVFYDFYFDSDLQQ